MSNMSNVVGSGSGVAWKNTMEIGEKITLSRQLAEYYEKVFKVIINGTYDSSSIPRSPYTNNPVVPLHMLDSSVYLSPYPLLASRGEKIDAKRDASGNTTSFNKAVTYGAIYNAVIYNLKTLLKVGKFTYSESIDITNKSGSGNTPNADPREYNISGKCIFTDATLLTMIYNNAGEIRNIDLNPADGGVSFSVKMTPATLNQLFSNCVNAWVAATKPHAITNYSYCHTNCHSNCHGNHKDCYGHDNSSYCYGNNAWVYGNLADEGFRCYEESKCHTDSGSTTYQCHTNSTWVEGITGNI